MTGNRRLIRQLARSAKIQRAPLQVAQDVAAEAEAIDPDAEVTVYPSTMSINGLSRGIAVVENGAESAARHEFDGDPPLRPMGRAASKHKG